MNSKKITILLLVGLIVLAAGIAIALRSFNEEQSDQVTSSVPSTNSQSQDSELTNHSTATLEGSATQTFYSQENNFTLVLPKDWSVKQSDSYILFSSPETKAKLEQNKKNCDANDPSNACVTEGPGADIVFSPTSVINEALPGTQTSTIFNGVTFTQFAVGGEVAGMDFETQDGAKTYRFSSYIDLKQTADILSTFKFGK